ncbi:ScaI family restriction endonuclease [Vibrio parahaemolyticus]|uniref:ScaI family restriction endonuclease n=1 Tax=Vibrio parahaemolyticus TaxID=670 RepID=UPI0009EFAC94|nr:ScaI family restriction endonuclease [Vibrio parahaemolyticus]EGQ9759771.1 ScaI family restriction endonuclease [Vibrio parahaemolyticus]EIV8511411.1 ScaI family restriction endonuclease [Vibrio parahaemolyticus]EJR2791178.1 ScaI family restriction endonuclease [Vibrio parahaemolyticus]OQU07122.1 restriction endonuclease [Vibrio parahaemolyticus]
MSPYYNVDKSNWAIITQQLIDQHPLQETEIVDVILTAWNNIFASTFGSHRIGSTIFPKPQIIGAILHELVPAELAARYPQHFRKEVYADDKDIVCIPNDFFSIELKTSSNATKIFANRSYAQQPTIGKKSKDGYYIAVNFEKFSAENPSPKILNIRFGWLDHSDWRGQISSSGQQANLAPETYQLKFKTLYTSA